MNDKNSNKGNVKKCFVGGVISGCIGMFCVLMFFIVKVLGVPQNILYGFAGAAIVCLIVMVGFIGASETLK